MVSSLGTCDGRGPVLRIPHDRHAEDVGVAVVIARALRGLDVDGERIRERQGHGRNRDDRREDREPLPPPRAPRGLRAPGPPPAPPLFPLVPPCSPRHSATY